MPKAYGRGNPSLGTIAKNQVRWATPTTRDWKDGAVGVERESPDELPTWPPSPASPDWGWALDRWPGLAPATEDAAQPGVRGVAHGLPDRVDRLRALGNAVVPIQAAVAFNALAERF